MRLNMFVFRFSNWTIFAEIYEILLLTQKIQGLAINFLAVFSSSKSQRAIERGDDSLMLATIRDDTWNVPNMQHIISNSKKMEWFKYPQMWP